MSNTVRGSRTRAQTVRALLTLAFGLSGTGARAQTASLEGVTFAESPKAIYLPLREVGTALGWPVRWDPSSRSTFLNDRPVATTSTEILVDGTVLISVLDLEDWSKDVQWDPERQVATISHEGEVIKIRSGPKRVVVDRKAQQLRAWQGERLVLQSRVSTGRRGHSTPVGSFTAGPYKARMHRSSLYNDAPMPWSVQVNGNVFIHGFSSVPDYPASHGCIRMPLTGSNPARWFYRWVDTGTPVVIRDGESTQVRAAR